MDGAAQYTAVKRVEIKKKGFGDSVERRSVSAISGYPDHFNTSANVIKLRVVECLNDNFAPGSSAQIDKKQS